MGNTEQEKMQFSERMRISAWLIQNKSNNFAPQRFAMASSSEAELFFFFHKKSVRFLFIGI